MRMLIILFAILLMGFTNLFSEGNLAKQKPITVVLTMSEFSFTPNHLEFETGKLYKLVLRNVGKIKHELDSSSISHLAYTRKIQILDKSGALIAEVKGVPAEIEVGAGYEVEWWFVPIATVSDEPFVCLLSGHYEAGMKGTLSFK